MNNGDIINGEVGVPLVSFEDAEHFDTSETHSATPSLLKERSRKRLRLFLSKGVFYAIGLLLVAVGCVLLLSFRHDDVTEMCMLDGEANYTIASPSSLAPSATVIVPSPTSTWTGHLQNSHHLLMSTSFVRR